MHSRHRLIFSLGVVLLLNLLLTWTTFGLFSPGAIASDSSDQDESYQCALLFSRVIEIIRQDYVDEKKIGYRDLTYAALRGMLSSLDPHSQFLDQEAFQDIQRETKGEFSGLGIMVGSKDNAIIILTPIEGSPGARAGLLPGDRIIGINGKNTEKMTLSQVSTLLRGKAGERASLSLFRPLAGSPNGGSVFSVDLVRETIHVSSVKDARLLPASVTNEDKVGYVRIEEFTENTSDELDVALSDLMHQGMQSLILDLRNNPGGLLDSAVDVAGKFVPPNTVIVSTRGRTPDQAAEYRARPEREQPDYPMAILVNGFSASGAEIVAGALKDLNRAVIVGETTFGKGSVQTVQPLGDGIGLRLTTAKYYTPSMQTIHEVGVKPDIPVPLTDEEERRVTLSQARRPLTPDEQIEVAKVQDVQLERAVGSLKSISIFNQRQAALNPDARMKVEPISRNSVPNDSATK